jgi:hypothetical protein
MQQNQPLCCQLQRLVIASLRKSGASRAAVCQETGLSTARFRIERQSIGVRSAT